MASNVPHVTEGTVPFTDPSLPKPCETWYKIYGHLEASTTARPLVTLHGGPGACHNYLLPIADLSTQYGVPVIFYDQLGNGNSTHLREKRLDTTFWTPELFMAELENLLEHLGIANDYDLLGQSWGGMLGAMWAIRGHRGLKRLIISNSPADMGLWVESCNELRKELPAHTAATLEKCEAEQDYENPAYEAAVMEFYKRYLCRVYDGDIFPKDVMDTLDWLKKDDTVYFTMNGPSEFTVVGSLKTWSVVEEVKKISVPTLLISGEYDEAQDICVAPYFRNIPKVKWVTMDGGSHMCHVDVREKYMKVVMDFLKNA